jgi:hypothetical protein
MAILILSMSRFTAAEACRVEHAWKNRSNILTTKEVGLANGTLRGDVQRSLGYRDADPAGVGAVFAPGAAGSGYLICWR